MSRFFFRLSKLSLANDALRHKRSFRLFSSSITTPYMVLGTRLKKDLPDGSEIRDVFFFDPAKEELLTIPDKTFPEELIESRQIGSSHGWGLFFNDHDRSLCMSDLYQPLTSKSNPKIIPLPSFVALPTNQTDIVWNVAMSSSSPSEEDCVVGVKFLGRQLSLYRPHCDWRRWTNIEVVPVGNMVKLESSNLMYSKRDQRFYLPAPGGNDLYSWDLHLEKNKIPEVHQLLFRDLPELAESEWGQLDHVCCRTEHLVESASSGERFLVKWYAQGCFSSSRKKIGYTTERFMVFREEETTEGRYMCYTEDTGDVCIFLSKSEAFCVESSSYPGLKPNSIYCIGHTFGIYSLADNTSHHFQVPEGEPTSFKNPYWLPPSCM